MSSCFLSLIRYFFCGLLALSLCFTSFEALAQKRSYHQDYTPACKNAENWVSKHKVEIRKYLSSPAFSICVILPEVSRYNSMRDKLETTSLEALYVRFGPSYADFSIGLFQMKPSWASTIERLSKTHKIHNNLAIEAKTIQLIRKERIKRLSQYKWQLQYLEAFYKIAKLKYPFKAKKLSFMATLYNTGFVSIEKIKKWQKIKAFPSGNARKPLQHAYGDVANEFYSKVKSILQ